MQDRDPLKELLMEVGLYTDDDQGETMYMFCGCFGGAAAVYEVFQKYPALIPPGLGHTFSIESIQDLAIDYIKRNIG